MSKANKLDPSLAALLPAVGDELADLALEVSVLGETLSSAGERSAQFASHLQKFDAITQAIASYARILRGVPDTQNGEVEPQLLSLLDTIPFFPIRQRLHDRVTGSSLSPCVEDDDDIIWVEC